MSARFDRDSAEFARVANLSDGVFAIAMTLLVLTLATPAAVAGRLAESPLEQAPQLVVFALAFGLVANLWWQHHKLFALFDKLEPVMVGINLALLGMVALVPFPTSLVGVAPTDRSAVLPFVAVFLGLSLLFLLLAVRARRTDAFRSEVTAPVFHWMLGQWVAGIVVLVVAALLALWLPIVSLSILALTIVFGPLAARRGVGPAQRLSERFNVEERPGE